MKVFSNGKKWKGVKVEIYSQIMGRGNQLKPCEQPFSFSGKWYVQCLSITHKTWIITDKTFYYVGSVVDKKTGDILPKKIV